MRFYQRRLPLCAAFISTLWLIYSLLHNARVQTIRTAATIWFTDQAGVVPCKFNKPPMLFEHGDDHYYIVWETSCTSGAPLLEWWVDSTSRHSIEPWYRKIDDTHHRYTAIVGPVANASQVHYKVENYRLSTAEYTIVRRGKSELNRMLVISDNQNGPTAFRNVLSGIQQYYGIRSKPDTILHVGDAVQNVGSLSNWQRQLFSPLEDRSDLHHAKPMIFVPGNHDHDKRRSPNNRNFYMDMYHGLNETDDLGKVAVANGSYHRFYHSLSVGSARIIVLDSECPSREESEFLERELQSEAFQTARFRIVAVHIPPYIEFWDPYTWNHKNEKHWGEHIRVEYDPLFRKHNVDLVISGHQHNYQRSTISRDIESPQSGTITYAIVGGAGGTLDFERVEDWEMYNVTYLGHHFVALDIKDRSLGWTALNSAGAVIDHFLIAK